MNKEQRKALAQAVVEEAKALQKTRIATYYSRAQLAQLTREVATYPAKDGHITTIQMDVVEAIRQYAGQGKIAVLNFASAKHPGGGFLNGSSAQEESLARSSDMYLYLKGLDAFYKNPLHHQSGLYDSDMIYAKDVTLLRDADGNKIPHQSFDVITSCAVNAGVLPDELKSEVKSEMKERIHYMLELAVRENVEVFILGAFGCGVFKNNPYHVKKLFDQALKSARYQGKFKQVVFAIYGSDHLYRILT